MYVWTYVKFLECSWNLRHWDVVDEGLIKCSEAVKVWSGWYWRLLSAAVITVEFKNSPLKWWNCLHSEHCIYVLCWLARMSFSCMSLFGVLVYFVLCVLLPVKWTRKGMMAKWFRDFSVISKETGVWELVDLNQPSETFYIFI